MTFQAYLLEGIVRWNQDRGVQAVEGEPPAARTYNSALQHEVNRLTNLVYGEALLPHYQVPRAYTGKKIGVEYLYAQTGKLWSTISLDPDTPDDIQLENEIQDNMDEGFEDDEYESDLTIPMPSKPPSDSSVEGGDEVDESIPDPETIADDITTDEPEIVGPSGIIGWQSVTNLAEALFQLKDVSVLTTETENTIIALWNELPRALKSAKVNYPPRYKTDSSQTGRFMQKKTQTVTPGIVSLRRAMVDGNSGPATAVDACPIAECLCKKLQSVFNTPAKKHGKTDSRWHLILDAYHHIRELVTTIDIIMDNTNIQLYELNQTTLLKWWNDHQKDLEKRVLSQGLPLPPPKTAAKPLPTARPLLPKPIPPPPPPHTFPIPTPQPLPQQPSTSHMQSEPLFNSPINIEVPKSTQYYQNKKD